MKVFRSMRFVLIALLISVAAASMHAQFSFSVNVGFAPPMLPVYEQPPCPQPNLMWTPGYWAYSNDQGDYYWVPGAWVPAPYSGALWTPPYWGWNNGRYGFHNGYWGRQVGYYGGVNYGYGYGGNGFAGGEWRGNSFAYNTAVVHVNETVVHVTYVNETIVRAGIVENPNHVAYNGGPGGIQHSASAAEVAYERQPHTAPTSVQTQHAALAKADKTSFAKANGGHPVHVAVAKPLAARNAASEGAMKTTAPAARTAAKPEVQQRAAVSPHRAPAVAKTEGRAAVRTQPKPVEKERPAPQARVAQRSAPTQRAAQEPHAAPAQRVARAPKPEPKDERKPDKR